MESGISYTFLLVNFYREIHMPTNLRELGVNATEEQLEEMAHKCAVKEVKTAMKSLYN